jgi:hypothetical protein
VHATLSKVLATSTIVLFLVAPSVAWATNHYSPPRARNYGFIDLGSEDEASMASSVLDSEGYNSYACPSQPAHYAFDRMNENAVFSFIGHGLEDGQERMGLGLYFYNTWDYPIHKRETYFHNSYGTNSDTYVYMDRYVSSMEDMLLAVNVACGSAATHYIYGNMSKKMVDNLGVSCSIGFYKGILPGQAKSWHRRFFEQVDQHSSFGDAAYVAFQRVGADYNGNYGGTESVMVYGVSAAHIDPARYGAN